MKQVHFAEPLRLADNLESPPTVIIHPELSQPTYIDYDISSITSGITITGSSKNQRLLSEPATSPPLSSLKIHCRYLPWQIDVRNSAQAYVTVEDVLEGIYESLRTNITQAEWANLPPQRERAIATAYERRWRRISDPTMQSAERSKGVKRVDLLGDNCGFNGLSCTYRNGSLVEFTLHLRMITIDPLRRSLSEVLGLPPLHTRRAADTVKDGSQSYEQGLDSHNSELTSLNESGPRQPSTRRADRETDLFQAQTPMLHIPPRRGMGDLGEQSFTMNDGDTLPVHGAEPTLVSSMFKEAHDFTISGGQFYSAPGGNITVDSSQDASNHLTTVTNLWQYNHGSSHIALATTVPSHIVRAANEIEMIKGKKEPYPVATSSLGEESSSQTREEGPITHIACSPREDETSARLDHEGIYHLEQLDDLGEQHALLEMGDVQEESSNNLVVVQSSSTTFYDHPSEHNMIIDDIIFDTLSRYSLSPLGSDARSVHRIISALLFSFSPLSLGALATLLKFDDAQQVKAILLPASPFIVVPDSNTDSELVGYSDEEHGIHTWAPVRFMDPSIAEFFLDRMRSGQYYADAFVGHRALLDACMWVMARVDLGPRRENTFETSMQSRWGEAYEYACRNWERHLLVGNKCRRRIRSKL